MVGFALSIYRGYKNAINLRRAILFTLIVGIAIPAASQDGLTVESVSGTVSVRYGVAEEWEVAQLGMVVRPEDTIRTGRNGTLVLKHHDGTIYRIPSETMLDGSDFRSIDRNELLLLLAAEDMLSVPERSEEDRPVPQTTVLHGELRSSDTETSDDINSSETVGMRMNGATYLADQNYTGSAILKIRETLRLYPYGKYRVPAMLFAAESLERLTLLEEAVKYYRTILESGPDIATRQKAEMRIEALSGKMREE
jgi:hypothetical protein